jgi:hypothetical protein
MLGWAEREDDGWLDLPGCSHRFSGNEPFGSRPEPGICRIASILLLPPGEVPEGRARGVQDTASRVQSESER